MALLLAACTSACLHSCGAPRHSSRSLRRKVWRDLKLWAASRLLSSRTVSRLGITRRRLDPCADVPLPNGPCSSVAIAHMPGQRPEPLLAMH